MNKRSLKRMHILNFILSFRRDNGYSPSIREIGWHEKIKSTSVVNYYLDIFEDAKLITRDDNVARSIVPNEENIQRYLDELVSPANDQTDPHVTE